MYNSDTFDYNGNGRFEAAERAFRDEFLTGGFDNDDYSRNDAWGNESADLWKDDD